MEGKKALGVFWGLMMKSGNLLSNLLLSLESHSVSYVSWKNNHELGKALNAGRDIDILVPNNHKGKFNSIMRKEGWVEMDNQFIRYPWITHYYKLSEAGQIFHIHVYHKLVTGESLAKEYELPWVGFLMENRVKNNQGVWVLNEHAQVFIFTVRHLLKGGRFFSRLRYKRELDSYNEEFWLSGGLNKVSWDDTPFTLKEFIVGSGLSGKKISLPSLLTAMRFRIQMGHFKRQAWGAEKITAANIFFLRVLNRFFIKSKKIFLTGGLVIAVTGNDGSGKTTMLNSIKKDFGSFATVKSIHMGRPLPSWVERIIGILTSRKNKQNTKTHVKVSASHDKKLKNSTALMAVLIALFRLHRTKQAAGYARKGYLVLTDRWPTRAYGKMDGPRINPALTNSYFLKTLGKIEHRAYTAMSEADFCFVFKVPLSVAISRNISREEVEDEGVLIARYKNNQDPQPICLSKIDFDNSGEYCQKLKEFRSLVWSKIGSSVVWD
ncbi:hypothetical protein EQ836_23285 [Ectopseudomonas mendocina]|uniref:KAP NTPase domain-containing protein n=1 Tax=Ectopseudomonas mendocina TaxID=300 RepID=A0ABD7RRF7_ECTME|nr:nucleotidyltransferase family protein [Pseudomonas mendocina]TRO10080.1 hypothetical protein EQ829_23085 [Pseudomonas mendocina]TRO12148.1 hypothetical protein EQ836_23285 [Pseudomonas mendocina]